MDLKKSPSWKYERCLDFMDKLVYELRSSHTIMNRGKDDEEIYLVPDGTEEQMSHYETPIGAFRLSDHWNWRANVKKCSDLKKIQCENVDVPKARGRAVPGGSSKPRECICVAYYGPDKKYHTVYGECWDKTCGRYYWKNSKAEDVVRHAGL